MGKGVVRGIYSPFAISTDIRTARKTLYTTNSPLGAEMGLVLQAGATVGSQLYLFNLAAEKGRLLEYGLGLTATNLISYFVETRRRAKKRSY